MFCARRRGVSPATLLVFTLLLANLVTRPALAIQLHWAGGATDLTVTQNTQAVLVVQADSAEATLPNTWRLQWTADSLGVAFSAFDPNTACLVDTAKVDSVAPPSTPADSAAHQVTARFCSDGSENATVAYFLVDLPANGHGKMKVVALDPADTTQVIESSEATFNGGVSGGSRAQAATRLYVTNVLSGAEHAKMVVELPRAGIVQVVVFDVLGRKIRSLVDRQLGEGRTEIEWNGRSEAGDRVSSGLYFVRLRTDHSDRIARLPLIR